MFAIPRRSPFPNFPLYLAIAFMDKFLVACGTCVDVFSSTGQYEESYTKRVEKHLHIAKDPHSFRGTKPKNISKAHCLVIKKDDKIIVGNGKESTITMFNSDHTIFQNAFKIPVEGLQPMRLATNDEQLVMSRYWQQLATWDGYQNQRNHIPCQCCITSGYVLWCFK